MGVEKKTGVASAAGRVGWMMGWMMAKPVCEVITKEIYRRARCAGCLQGREQCGRREMKGGRKRGLWLSGSDGRCGRHVRLRSEFVASFVRNLPAAALPVHPSHIRYNESML